MRTLSSAAVGFADLATNILAIVVAALLLVSTLPAGRPVPAEQRVAAAGAVDRRPLGGADMIAHLAGHRRESGDTAIDLHADRIDVWTAGRALTLPPDDPGALLAAVTDAAGSVRLNVFSNRHYAAVARAFAGAGIAATELSVPAALRDPTGRSWSDGFLALAADASDLPRFRAGLAALLAGSDRHAAAGAAGAAATDRAAATPAEALLDRVLGTLGTTLALTAFGLAAAAVIVIERRQWRAR